MEEKEYVEYNDCPILCNLKKSKTPLVSSVPIDEFTNMVQNNFDYTFTGESKFYPYEIPNELLKEGATEIYACATHGIFSEQAVELLKNTPFTEVIITDTIEIPENKKFDKLTILSTDTLFAETIKRISSDQSISDLFIRKE